MTSAEKKPSTRELSPVINRWAYGAFVVMSCYFLFVSGDLMTAASNLGIALIFDPFNSAVKWQDRKPYQRAWLMVHVILVIGLFVAGWLMK